MDSIKDARCKFIKAGGAVFGVKKYSDILEDLFKKKNI